MCEPGDVPHKKLLVCRAFAAQARFKAEKPAWAPELPVRRETYLDPNPTIEGMQRSPDCRLRLGGHFAESWRMRAGDHIHHSTITARDSRPCRARLIWCGAPTRRCLTLGRFPGSTLQRCAGAP
jgi:hypothetical protein